jgi:hypothetical protein
VLRAIVVDRTSVDAGDEVGATASVDGSVPAGSRFLWAVEPSGGVISADGSRARWRAPLDGPVPSTYVLSVTLVHTSLATLATTPVGQTNSNGAASSPPITVNDARREMSALSEQFLRDAADVNVAPEICVRNFTTSCPGRQQALDELTSSRAVFSAVSIVFEPLEFLRSVEWPGCVGPDGSARCAVLLYHAEWTRTRRSDGGQERGAGDQYVQGFYEQRRWWLCGAWFEAVGN